MFLHELFENTKSREEFEGITIETEKPFAGTLIVRALDDWGNNMLGFVVFNIGDSNELDPQDLSVDTRYQGQGIAKTMYDYVKSKGYKIIRSWDQTDAGAGFWNKHRGEDVRIWEDSNRTLTSKQVLQYVKQIHNNGDFELDSVITANPQWELKNVPLSQLNIDPDGEIQDPYNRVNWVDYDYVRELLPRIGAVLKNRPIVVDSQGWIIDGNHRAAAAADAGLKSVPAYVPVDVISESLSRVAYHYTNIANALKIVTSGKFELSSSLGSIEQQYAPPGYNYFLSTTRTKTGNYHRSRASSYGVIFVLDGNWFNNHYISKPIDYWENRNPQSGHHRDSEAEDRVFSKDSTIPIGGVVAMHVLADPDQYHHHGNAMVRELLISAKTQGIKTYLYGDFNSWANLDTRHTIAPTHLKGQRDKAWHRPKRAAGYMDHWIELMMKTNQSQLSKRADQMRYSLSYGYDKQEAAAALATDLSNARKPDSGQERAAAVKIIAFMRQHGLNTVTDFVNAIADKWKPQPVNEADLPKNQWQLIVSNADKMELGDELVNLVQTAYSGSHMGSLVNSLREVVPSDWNVIDWDDEPDVDATVFYRYARPKENWTGVKIQGLGHDGVRTSKNKAVAKIQELLSKPGCWIESSDAMRRVLMKLNVRPVTDEKFLQKLFNDPQLKMIDDITYARTLPNGHQITETVFGNPSLKNS